MLVAKGVNSLRRFYFNLVDKTIPYTKIRWGFTFLLCLLYIKHTMGMSYYIITYIIGFYLLQLIVNYFTPKGLEEDFQDDIQPAESYEDSLYHVGFPDPQPIPVAIPVCALQQQPTEDPSTPLPDDEKHPMAPVLSEVQIWERISYAFLMGLVCTSFKMFEIDVFWPLLVIYFLILVCYTVRKIIRQMVRHNYSLKDFVKH